MEHRKVDSSKTISQQIKQHNQKAQKHRIHKEFDLFEIENDWRQRKWIVEDRHEDHIVNWSHIVGNDCHALPIISWSSEMSTNKFVHMIDRRRSSRVVMTFDENDQLMMYISKMIWINEKKNVWIDREKQSEENPNAETADEIMSEMRIRWWDDTQTQSTNVHVVMSINLLVSINCLMRSGTITDTKNPQFEGYEISYVISHQIHCWNKITSRSSYSCWR